MAWHVKETVRGIYDIADSELAAISSPSSVSTCRTSPGPPMPSRWSARGAGSTGSPTTNDVSLLLTDPRLARVPPQSRALGGGAAPRGPHGIRGYLAEAPVAA